MTNEKMIEKYMKALEISREEAIQLIADDEAVDKMTKTSEIDSDLSEEQRQAKKKAKQADRKKTVYKFDTSNRKKKENNSKRTLINTIEKSLTAINCNDIQITNVEREIVFKFEDVKYKIVLSQPRS